MRERLYIAEDESIQDIAAKLASFPGEELILVAPRGAVIFDSLENLAFLQETARKLGSRLAIETEDPRGQRLSASLGLTPGVAPTPGPPVYDIVPPLGSTLEAGPREAEPHREFLRDEPQQEKEITQEETPASSVKEDSRTTAGARQSRAGFGRRTLWVVIPLALVGGFIGVHAFLSEATLKVKVRRQTQPFSEQLRVRTDASSIDVSRRVLPGERLEFSETLVATFHAQERSTVRERSRGQARVVNAFSSSPQTLVAGTRFAAPDGKIFRIERRLVVPGAKVEAGKIQPSSIVAQLVADEPGEAGNVKVATRFTIPGFSGTPKFDGFWAEALQDFAGGFVGEVTVVRARDIEAAQAEVRSSLTQKLEEYVSQQRAAGLTVLDQAKVIDIPRATSSVAAGGWAETFTLTAEGTLSALAFRETDLTSFLSAVLAKDNATLPSPVAFPSARFELASTTGKWDRLSNILELEVRGAASLPERFDAMLFSERVLGKRERDVRGVVLSTPAIESVELKLSPFWRRSVPSDPKKVKIVLE